VAERVTRGLRPRGRHVMYIQNTLCEVPDNWLFVGGPRESGFVILLIKSLRETAKFGILRRRSFLLRFLSGFRYCELALSLLE
jgi:hypothetical protein